MERTLVVIKPDGVERNLVGAIIKYYENAGLKVTKMEMCELEKDFVAQHYPESDEYVRSIGQKAKDAGVPVDDVMDYGLKIVQSLQHYLTEGPVVKMVLEGPDAVALARKVTGFFDPSRADKGSIRGDMGEDSAEKSNAEFRSTRNLVHASGNPEEAEAEIKLWFPR